MSAQDKVIDLLHWMKEKGLVPTDSCRGERFINVFTQRIERHRKRPTRTSHLLWIPSEKGIRNHLPDLEIADCDGLTIARSGNHIGAGPGESEAILSLVNRMRCEQAC